MLVIDPTNLTIANGTGASGSATVGNDTVFQNFIRNQLQAGSDVQLVASNSITLANLNSNTLDGRNSGGAPWPAAHCFWVSAASAAATIWAWAAPIRKAVAAPSASPMPRTSSPSPAG